MLDPESMAKLAQLKAELIAEEPKPEVIYPFKSSAKIEPDWNKVRNDFEENLNRYKSPPIKSSAPITNDSPKKKPKKKKKHKQIKQNTTSAPTDNLRKELFAARNRRMVATHSNIARSYYSGEGNSLYTYSGGDVRPK